MQKGMKIACWIAATFVWGSGAANAQSVVHAVGGTVVAVSPTAKTITLTLDNGTSDTFNYVATGDAKLSFAEDVRAETTSPDKVTASGSHVILYFIWANDGRTAVAVQGLGSGPFEKVTGTIVKFDKHARDLTLRTADGKTETVVVADKTVEDTADGVAEGPQFHAEKGEHVRLLAESKNGNEEALFVRPDGDD
jgi:hypothetical protein